MMDSRLYWHASLVVLAVALAGPASAQSFQVQCPESTTLHPSGNGIKCQQLSGGDGFATAPVSGDAVLLASTYIEPEFRGAGLGRVLIQSMAKDLIKHGGIGAVETFGAHRPHAGSCVLPVDFLLAVGFRTHRAHARFPRMRMDLRTTVTWREEFEAAAEKILGVVKRPGHKPVPQAPRGAHRGVSDPRPTPGQSGAH